MHAPFIFWAGFAQSSFLHSSWYGLSFGFVLKTVMIIQGWFCYFWAELTQSQGLFFPSPNQPADWVQGIERGHSWSHLSQRISQVTWKHIPAYKTDGRRRKGVCLAFWHLPSQDTVTHDGALFSWEWLDTCLPREVENHILVLLCLLCVVFALPIQIISSHNISHFYSSNSLPHSTAEERSVVWCLFSSWG